ncbi:hypothetical protein [Nonomuraea wenchangensis]|uniref:hypothetical protein n=1 Tax=Nonomuraea wenchangensis TaxID=568860 RepID=UPI003330ABCF
MIRVQPLTAEGGRQVPVTSKMPLPAAARVRANQKWPPKPAHVEGGLRELLEHLLFPLLLSHGLRNEPREPHRVYGAEPDDDRPARARSDARVTHEIDRASQVAVVLSLIPGVPDAQVIWDGSARPARDDEPWGATSPVNRGVDEARQAARLQIAGQMYDDAGRWIPADEGAHAVRQARDFLADRPHVEVLWGGPDAALPEPMWISVQVIEVKRGTGIGDVPGLLVLHGESLIGMRLCDIALVRRAEPTPTNADPAPADNGDDTSCDNAYLIDPTAEQAWRLVGHKIHQLAHAHPRSWRALDHLASKCRERLWTLLTEHGQDVTVTLWLRLSDPEVALSGPP